ncbi:MAG: ABC transporter permease, partial [bacterium]
MLIKLAFRNIFRNFKRTMITVIAIALGIMFMIVMDSVLAGMDQDSFRRIINYETGHIKIFDKGYREDETNFPLDKTINDPQKLI